MNTKFTLMKNALTSLQHSLECRKWVCAEDNQGKMCPVCQMPSHVTQVHVDKQLSNIASLCLQMSSLLDGNKMFSSVERDSHHKKSSECDAMASLKDTSKKLKTKEAVSSRKAVNYQALQQKTGEDKSTSESSISGIHQKGTKNVSIRTSLKKENVNANEMTRKIKVGLKEKKRSVSLPLHHLEGPKTTKGSPLLTKQGRKSEPAHLRDVKLTNNIDSLSLTPPPHASGQIVRNELKDRNSSNKNKAKNKTYLSKRNAKGETSLQVATIKADVNAVKKLLQDGSNPNVRDNAGWTPLHEAVNHGNHTIAELLLNHGASVNAPGLDNDTPLHDAVSNYHLLCVQLLVSRGANKLARNIHGRTPLDLAQTDEMREILLSASNSSITSSFDTSLIEEDDPQPLCFLGSSLSNDQQGTLQKCAKLLCAKIVADFTTEVTHLVTGVNAEGMCPRTLKYLNVVLAGKWVMNAEWLNACLKSGKQIPEEAFEIAGSCTNPNTMAPQKARQNRFQQLPGLFDGCQFYFHGKFSYPSPSREELAGLVKQGGGVILTREPRLHNLDDYPYTVPFHAAPSISLVDCAIYVIYDDQCSDPPHVEAQRMSCLPVSWLIDCIASFSLLDKSNYLKLTV